MINKIKTLRMAFLAVMVLSFLVVVLSDSDSTGMLALDGRTSSIHPIVLLIFCVVMVAFLAWRGYIITKK